MGQLDELVEYPKQSVAFLSFPSRSPRVRDEVCRDAEAMWMMMKCMYEIRFELMWVLVLN